MLGCSRGSGSHPSDQDRAAQYVRMSTEHQQYSIDNQIDAIREFAESHGIRIVRTYSDPGRSGLTLKHRPGLKRLLDDVTAGDTPFSQLLIYDVSRWGRFQNPDEAAAYEFHVHSHDISVTYCTEQFDNAGGPINSLLKHMKRSMAAEYSRDLSLRIARAKKKIALQGHWVSGTPPYAYERWAVAPDGRRMKLPKGEMRHSQQWRTRLEPGPPKEVALVRKAFDLFVREDLSLKAVAEQLSNDGRRRRDGSRWRSDAVRQILRNEIYCGDLVYNRKSIVLGGRQSSNPELEWVRVPNAFRGIVSRTVVQRAQGKIRTGYRPSELSDEELLEKLSDLLATKGLLSNAVIREDKSTPCPSFVARRFGGLSVAMELAGYAPQGRMKRLGRIKRARSVRTLMTGQLRLSLESIGASAQPLGLDSFQIEELSIACLVAQRSDEHGSIIWKTYVPYRMCDHLIIAKLDDGCDEPTEYRVVERSLVKRGPLFIGIRLDRISSRFTDIDAVAGRIAWLAKAQKVFTHWA